MFKGSIVALATPFKDNTIDEAKIKELVQFHIDNGTNGIVPCGTTGESPTLSHQEHDQVVAMAVEAARGRVPRAAMVHRRVSRGNAAARCSWRIGVRSPVA